MLQKWKKYVEKFFEKKEKKENKEVKEKVKEKEEKEEEKEKDKGVLFVFYNINKNAPEKSRWWTYKKFPKGWWWVGAGSVQPIKGEKVKSVYIREEQFSGPMNKREDMKDYLESYFAKLKEKKIVTKYKIRNRYAP